MRLHDEIGSPEPSNLKNRNLMSGHIFKMYQLQTLKNSIYYIAFSDFFKNIRLYCLINQVQSKKDNRDQ